VFSGLTHAEIDDAIRLIREIRARGATIVFVEHVIRAVMELTEPHRRAELRPRHRRGRSARGDA